MKGIDFKRLVEGTGMKPQEAADHLEITRQQLYRLYKVERVRMVYVDRIKSYGNTSKNVTVAAKPEASTSKETELFETIVQSQRDIIEILKAENKRLLEQLNLYESKKEKSRG